MNKLASIFVFLFAMTTLVSAQQAIEPAKAGVNYGKAIEKKNAISVKALETTLKEKGNYTGKVEAQVVEVCKSKGCYMTLKREGAEPITVRFTDYGYFVPQDLIGKTVVVEGKAKIKEPKKDISFIADGVLVIK
ncbi:protein of unknown function [Sphingobacterium nematocida]|uniref:DUF4920 domain-containing protein n=1 Tax=Sphingobacterium nematocida TaxID=1513896 RepID=A0A1T5E9G0_9SPHI|nr:DUF4920 domain-containing protein [Sphingobacterium nematocida]SKB80405.1 protein of unknown function [Sphingobacterium nematocida]